MSCCCRAWEAVQPKDLTSGRRGCNGQVAAERPHEATVIKNNIMNQYCYHVRTFTGIMIVFRIMVMLKIRVETRVQRMVKVVGYTYGHDCVLA